MLQPPASHSRKKRSLGLKGVFWPTGQTLRISFLGNPDPALKQSIFALANEWTLHANLDFELLDDDVEFAEIRIDTEVPSVRNSSAIGNQALHLEGPTMWLGTRPGDELFRTIVLHEFGHALGMKHEHQHPDAVIDWSDDYLRAKFAARNPGASDEKFREWVAINYEVVPAAPHVISGPYDTESIMHYALTADRINSGPTTQPNKQLSAGDIAFMRLHYPGR